MLMSPRLVLRPGRFSDRIWLQELLVDEDIRKKTLQPRVSGLMAPWVAMHRARQPHWVIERCDTPVGWICTGELKPSPHPAVGFEIRRRFWNQGFATEAVDALLSHYFSHTSWPTALGGLVFEDNRPSQRVFEKAGFREVGPRPCEGHACIMYEITAQNWRARTTSSPLR